jgi:glucose-1-phosphate thymidylyltransferase
MRGIIAAGGHATRLRPVTLVTNKHLLPVYNQPMIYYPINTLKAMGIDEVLIVSGREYAGHFLNLLGSGREFGMHFTYEIQEEAGGIAQVLGLGEDFAKNDPVALILGDNIFTDNQTFSQAADRFNADPQGSMIFLKAVSDPERFGVAEIKGKEIVGIEEKPKHPKSNLAVTGLYLYDASVFQIVRNLKPSGRGELEITDVNNSYVKQGTMKFHLLEGEWTDAGTFDSLLRANTLAAATWKAGQAK